MPKYVKYKCTFCSKEFFDYPSNKRSTCSRKCQFDLYSKERMGVKKINHLKGYKRPPFSMEHKERLSIAAEKRIAENRGSGFKSGKLHPSWKGGVTSEDYRLRRSRTNLRWKKQILERDNYSCQICGDKETIMHTNHIKPWSIYPELRFELSNGRTLCRKCHGKTDTYGNKSMYRAKKLAVH